MNRRVLTADEIFICNDLPREWVATPEWTAPGVNGDECGLYVSTMDAASKEQWEDRITDSRGQRDSSKVGIMMASALACVCVDEAGDKVFTAEQVDQLSHKSGAVVVRLWQAFRKLNVLTDADVSDLAKNSLGDRREDSSGG